MNSSQQRSNSQIASTGQREEYHFGTFQKINNIENPFLKSLSSFQQKLSLPASIYCAPKLQGSTPRGSDTKQIMSDRQFPSSIQSNVSQSSSIHFQQQTQEIVQQNRFSSKKSSTHGLEVEPIQIQRSIQHTPTRINNSTSKIQIESNSSTITSLVQNSKPNYLTSGSDNPLANLLLNQRTEQLNLRGYLKPSFNNVSQIQQQQGSPNYTPKFKKLPLSISKNIHTSGISTPNNSNRNYILNSSHDTKKLKFPKRGSTGDPSAQQQLFSSKNEIDLFQKKQGTYFMKGAQEQQNKLEKSSIIKDSQIYSSQNRSFANKTPQNNIVSFPASQKIIKNGKQEKIFDDKEKFHSKSSTLLVQPQYIEAIERMMHDEVVSAFSDVPRNRQDLKGLIRWIEKMKQINKQKNSGNIEEYRKCQFELIQVCLKELRQQIKIDFVEREEFFRQVWQENEEYYKSIIDDFEIIKLQINCQADSEYNRVHSFFQQMIKYKESQTQQAIEDKKKIEKKMIEIQEELTTTVKISNNYKVEMEKYKKICIFLKKKFAASMKEIEGMKSWQEDRINSIKQQLMQSIYQEQLLNQMAQKQIITKEEVVQRLVQQLNEISIFQNKQKEQIELEDHNKVHQLPIQTKEQIPEEKDEKARLDTEEPEGEDNFIFEYEEGGDLVQGVDQLNTVIVNNEQEAQTESKEMQVGEDLRESYTKSCGVQTDLILMNAKYDPILKNISSLDYIFEFHAHKEQLDGMSLDIPVAEYQQEEKNDKQMTNTLIEVTDENENSSVSSNSNRSIEATDQNLIESSKKQQKRKESIQPEIKQPLKRLDVNRQLSSILEQHLEGQLFDESTIPLALPVSIIGSHRGSINLSESNQISQKKKQEIVKKLSTVFQAEKIKKVLEDGGIKVVNYEAETKLEKFIKIYQLEHLKNQSLEKDRLDLQAKAEFLEKQSKQQQQENEKMTIINNSKISEINQLQEIIKKLKGQVDTQIQKQKEAAKVNTVQVEEEQETDRSFKKTNQPRIFKPQKKDPKMISTAFQLGKKVNIEWEFQKQANLGKVIVEKARSKKMAKFHNFMTVKTLLKQISMLYNERLSQTKENSNFKDIDFSNFAYHYYSSQYGVKKIADQKFLILILSVKKYEQILRVNIFAKFLGLIEGPLNYSTEELNKYIDVLDFVTNISQAGTNYTNNESEQRFLVPYIKAIHYISQFGDSRMKSEENAELRKDLENMKMLDSNKIPVLDFDSYMARLLITYRALVSRAKQYVINAFNACDLDGNRKCNFQEWSMLNRHIEPTKFDDDQLVQVFEQNADILDVEGEKNLSFDKFAIVSLEYELFTDEAQDRYLEIKNPSQLKSKFEGVLQSWRRKKQEYEFGFKELQNIDEEAIEEWMNIISVLDEKLNSALQQNASLKPLLIAENILEKEYKMLKQDNLEQLTHQTKEENP